MSHRRGGPSKRERFTWHYEPHLEHTTTTSEDGIAWCLVDRSFRSETLVGKLQAYLRSNARCKAISVDPVAFSLPAWRQAVLTKMAAIQSPRSLLTELVPPTKQGVRSSSRYQEG